jgi:transketolase
MRQEFSDYLVSLAQADPKVLLLNGDHGYALFDDFRKKCPKQYINAGIAEQNMVGMAAGLARLGFKPYVYGLSAFIPIRVLEQIKLDVAHDGLNVKFIGDGAGFVYSYLGTSHQSTEDIACLRAIPNLEILSPSDSFEMLACMEYCNRASFPIYLRIGKCDIGNVHKSKLKIFNKGMLLDLNFNKADSPTLIATGSMVFTALQIGIEFGYNVWSAPFIKPLNSELIQKISNQTKFIITIEEHSKFGGLGSSVLEILSKRSKCSILTLGVNDKFSKNCGSYQYLLKEHELDKESLVKKIKNFLI